MVLILGEWTLKITTPEGLQSELLIDESLASLHQIGEERFVREQFSRLLFDLGAKRRKLKEK